MIIHLRCKRLPSFIQVGVEWQYLKSSIYFASRLSDPQIYMAISVSRILQKLPVVYNRSL